MPQVIGACRWVHLLHLLRHLHMAALVEASESEDGQMGLLLQSVPCNRCLAINSFQTVPWSQCLVS